MRNTRLILFGKRFESCLKVAKELPDSNCIKMATPDHMDQLKGLRDHVIICIDDVEVPPLYAMRATRIWRLTT